MTTVYLLLISSCLLQWSGAFTPVVYDAKVSPSSQCGQSNPFEDDQQLMKKLKMIHQQLPPPGCNPPPTCRDILRCNSSASSGYYQIRAANGSTVQVYCDMVGTNCGGEGGWMRVANLNANHQSNLCPDGFQVMTHGNKKFCIRDAHISGCRSIPIETFGNAYSQVCGKVRGYSYGAVDGFSRSSTVEPDENYVDGVTITYGSSPALHIWTYAAGLEEGRHQPQNCPCNTQPGQAPPSFVGNDYYCESGSPNFPTVSTWLTDDPLWDGAGCGGQEGPCCNRAGLPWFNKAILNHSTATINVRICLDTGSDENIGIEELVLYIK